VPQGELRSKRGQPGLRPAAHGLYSATALHSLTLAFARHLVEQYKQFFLSRVQVNFDK